MRRTIVTRAAVVLAAAASLAFGTVQAFASPSPSDARAGICEPYDCRGMCGLGCGGTCINNECYCDC